MEHARDVRATGVDHAMPPPLDDGAVPPPLARGPSLGPRSSNQENAHRSESLPSSGNDSETDSALAGLQAAVRAYTYVPLANHGDDGAEIGAGKRGMSDSCDQGAGTKRGDKEMDIQQLCSIKQEATPEDIEGEEEGETASGAEGSSGSLGPRSGSGSRAIGGRGGSARSSGGRSGACGETASASDPRRSPRLAARGRPAVQDVKRGMEVNRQQGITLPAGAPRGSLPLAAIYPHPNSGPLGKTRRMANPTTRAGKAVGAPYDDSSDDSSEDDEGDQALGEEEKHTEEEEVQAENQEALEAEEEQAMGEEDEQAEDDEAANNKLTCKAKGPGSKSCKASKRGGRGGKAGKGAKAGEGFADRGKGTGRAVTAHAVAGDSVGVGEKRKRTRSWKLCDQQEQAAAAAATRCSRAKRARNRTAHGNSSHLPATAAAPMVPAMVAMPPVVVAMPAAVLGLPAVLMPAGAPRYERRRDAYKAAYRQTCALHGVQGQTDLEHQSTHVLRTLCEGVGLNELAHLQLPVLKARVAEAIAARLLTVGHNCILTPQVLAQALEGTVPLPVAGVQQVLGPLLLFRGRRYHRQEVQMRAAGFGFLFD